MYEFTYYMVFRGLRALDGIQFQDDDDIQIQEVTEEEALKTAVPEGCDTDQNIVLPGVESPEYKSFIESLT